MQKQQRSQPVQGRLIVDQLGRRSTWVFLALALLAVASYWLLAAETTDERASAAEINHAGKRRMLSQRIGFLVSQSLQHPSPENRELLRDSLQQLERTHDRLIRGDAEIGIRPPRSEKLKAAYFGDGGLDPTLRHFLELGRTLLATPAGSEQYRAAANEMMRLSQGDFLIALDNIVGQYQAESEHSTDTLRLLQVLALLTTLLLLLYSARGLLRPLIAQVRTVFGELEESQAAVQRAGEENRLLLATAGDGIFGIARDGRITFANPAAATMLGRDASLLIGRPHHPTILADGAACPICRLLAGGNTLQYCEGEFARGQASNFPVEYSVAIRPDGEGAVVSFRDISDRRQAETMLQRLQQRMADAIESMDDAFALFDPDDRLALYNMHFAELFPISGDVIRIGLPFAELVDEVARHGLYAVPPEALADWVEERVKAHRQASGSSELPLSDGRWMRVSERRTRDGATVVIWSDVTHLKQALITADHASAAKSEFLARMSHELRTPLNAILGFAQVLDKANDPPLSGKQQESVAHILQGGRHLLGLINEVLDLSAIEAGRLHVDLADVPLAPLLRECLALVSPQAADRKVTIEAGDPGSLSVYADRTRLKQVLINLLSNGVKYNRPGGRLGIDFSEQEDRVRLAIADTGRGIPADLAERIFRPFDRLGVNQVEGTGIGLAITRRLVELMGGRIDFTSQVGVGTTFRVDLSRREGTTTAADTDAHPGPSPAAPADTQAQPQAPASGHTLLAIGVPESDAGMLRLVASTLRETTLLLAGTVDDAGIQLAKQRFQAIIADESVLPALGAIDTRGLPLVVLGADPAPEDWAGEGRHWQRKPLKPRDMARILRELLQ